MQVGSTLDIRRLNCDNVRNAFNDKRRNDSIQKNVPLLNVSLFIKQLFNISYCGQWNKAMEPNLAHDLLFVPTIISVSLAPVIGERMRLLITSEVTEVGKVFIRLPKV